MCFDVCECAVCVGCVLVVCVRVLFVCLWGEVCVYAMVCMRVLCVVWFLCGVCVWYRDFVLCVW